MQLLDYVKAKTYDRVYPELTALQMFPVTHEVPEGAETVTYYGYEKRGLAKIIANYADDLPRADVAGQPKTAHVKAMGDSYGYSVQDMRASRMAGKNLDARKGEAARYAIDRLTNSIAWKGDAENNLVGVLSEDNDIPIYTLGTGAQGSKTDWSSKTIDEIILDVSGMLAQVNLATQNTEHPDTLAIPSETYTRLSLQRIPETATSARKYLQDNLHGIQVVSCAELNSTAVDTNPYAKDKDGNTVANPNYGNRHGGIVGAVMGDKSNAEDGRVGRVPIKDRMTKKIGDTVERGARNIRYAPNRGQSQSNSGKVNSNRSTNRTSSGKTYTRSTSQSTRQNVNSNNVRKTTTNSMSDLFSNTYSDKNKKGGKDK